MIELMIAAVASFFIVAGAFLWTTKAAEASSSQTRMADLASRGRQALDMIGRDIRGAGDSVQLLPEHCLAGAQPPNPEYGCAAILEAHPWRVTLARYAWGVGADGIEGTADDDFPSGLFTASPGSVTTYQFVPRGDLEVLGGVRRGYVGRIERIRNPFGFGGVPATVDVLIDNVLLDNEMRASPDGKLIDHRRDYSLFLYQLMSVATGEYEGNPVFTARDTREGAFLLPPIRLYEFPADPVSWAKAFIDAPPAVAPFLTGGYEPEIVGLEVDSTAKATLRAGRTFAEDIRYILDFNRIRAVRVAFKVVEPRDDMTFQGGIDLDPERPGTARVVSVGSTFELKALSSFLQ